MSWSIIIQDLESYAGLDAATIETLTGSHPLYPGDAQIALALARLSELKSWSLSGGRTSNPYGGDDIVDISIHGFTRQRDYVATMKHVVVMPQGRDA